MNKLLRKDDRKFELFNMRKNKHRELFKCVEKNKVIAVIK